MVQCSITKMYTKFKYIVYLYINSSLLTLYQCNIYFKLGMHALGWSREEAVQYMLKHTAASEPNIRGEVHIHHVLDL